MGKWANYDMVDDNSTMTDVLESDVVINFESEWFMPFFLFSLMQGDLVSKGKEYFNDICLSGIWVR